MMRFLSFVELFYIKFINSSVHHNLMEMYKVTRLNGKKILELSIQRAIKKNKKIFDELAKY